MHEKQTHSWSKELVSKTNRTVSFIYFTNGIILSSILLASSAKSVYHVTGWVASVTELLSKYIQQPLVLGILGGKLRNKEVDELQMSDFFLFLILAY